MFDDFYWDIERERAEPSERQVLDWQIANEHADEAEEDDPFADEAEEYGPALEYPYGMHELDADPLARALGHIDEEEPPSDDDLYVDADDWQKGE